MNLDQYIRLMLPAVEEELKRVVKDGVSDEVIGLRLMLSYHMGWEGEGAGLEAQGKRIRPLLVLLSAVAAGGGWEQALPAAVSVELVHNFSLIHDDIQDCSETRRGRPTVWVRWGVAQAINSGDLMFTLAFYSLNKLFLSGSPAAALEASRILQEACIDLTRGQYLDLLYAERKEIGVSDYWPMVGGKTAALLSAAVGLGALSAGASMERRQSFRKYGYTLGLAFQAWDDWLGLWGDPLITGKSNASDLIAGKKTLPVIYALNSDAVFRERWLKGPIHSEEVPTISEMLIKSGAKEYTEKEATRLTDEALVALEQAAQNEDGLQALRELTHRLLGRKN
ncbi:MAG: polyprenyl synthetase family protein [Anaerolineae bacterium]|nr:polyprenyl synthetase family protein [Anaerolineae bacterium]